jgi:hypothetical protein
VSRPPANAMCQMFALHISDVCGARVVHTVIDLLGRRIRERNMSAKSRKRSVSDVLDARRSASDTPQRF